MKRNYLTSIVLCLIFALGLTSCKSDSGSPSAADPCEGTPVIGKWIHEDGAYWLTFQVDCTYAYGGSSSETGTFSVAGDVIFFKNSNNICSTWQFRIEGSYLIRILSNGDEIKFEIS